MTEADVRELKVKVDQVQEAITRLEEKMTETIIRQPGIIRTDHAHIVRVEGVCGGRPVIEGTRLSVKLIVGWAKMGMSPEEIADQYAHVPLSQISDALVYYQDHPEEIEAEFAEEERYLKVEMPRLRWMIAEGG